MMISSAPAIKPWRTVDDKRRLRCSKDKREEAVGEEDKDNDSNREEEAEARRQPQLLLRQDL